MRILLTRSEPDATELKRRLEALGHQSLVAPVLDIEFCAPPALLAAGPDALIATSRNALRAVRDHAELASLLKLPIFVVGPGTASLVRQLGFAEIVEGPAAARDLPPVIAGKFPDRRATLVQLAGDVLAFDLVGALNSAGFRASKVVVYRSLPARTLPPETITALRSGALDACIVMSPRAAVQFASLVADAGLDAEARRLTYLCLSPAVAGKLAVLAPPKVSIAERPNLEEVLALVTSLAEN